MCQLIYVKTNSTLLTKLLVHRALLHGSTANFDGTGIFSPKTGLLWKTRLGASKVVGIGETLNKVLGDSSKSIIAHVRAASRGIEVVDSNAHPFEGKRFVLAHNGRLWKKDAKVVYNAQASDTSDISDSLAFLTRLEELAESNSDKSFVELLSLAMGEFKGKFALLVYDKATGKTYAARGKTADLHVTSIFPGIAPEVVVKEELPQAAGYVVMTQAKSLGDAVSDALSYADGMQNKLFWYSTPVLLEENSVFELQAGGPIKIGEVAENAVTYETAHKAPAYSAYQAVGQTVSKPASGGNTKTTHEYLIALTNWMQKYYVSLKHMDTIVFEVFGYGIADLDETSLRYVVNDLLPALTPSNSCLKLVANSSSTMLFFPYEVVWKEIPDFQFPWTCNTKATIARAMGVIKRSKKA